MSTFLDVTIYTGSLLSLCDVAVPGTAGCLAVIGEKATWARALCSNVVAWADTVFDAVTWADMFVWESGHVG